MNCTHTKDQILLAHSGELGEAERALLEGHLASCADCAAYQADLLELAELEPRLPLEREVDVAVLSRIHEEAAAHTAAQPARASRHRRQNPPGFMQTWRPAIIYAAAAVLLLLFTLNLLHRPQSPVASVPEPVSTERREVTNLLAWDLEVEEDLSELESMLTVAFSDMGEEESVEIEESLDALAAELLELEGWNI